MVENLRNLLQSSPQAIAADNQHLKCDEISFVNFACILSCISHHFGLLISFLYTQLYTSNSINVQERQHYHPAPFENAASRDVLPLQHVEILSHDIR